jgi:hypothetical protein
MNARVLEAGARAGVINYALLSMGGPPHTERRWRRLTSRPPSCTCTPRAVARGPAPVKKCQHCRTGVLQWHDISPLSALIQQISQQPHPHSTRVAPLSRTPPTGTHCSTHSSMLMQQQHHLLQRQQRLHQGPGAFGATSLAARRRLVKHRPRCSARQEDVAQVSRVSNSGGSRKAFSQVGATPWGCRAVCCGTAQPPATAHPHAALPPSGPPLKTQQAFCRLTGITTSPVQEITPAQLAGSEYPAYQPPLSSVTVQQKR